MVWEENSRICLHMQLIAILSRIGVYDCNKIPLTAMTLTVGYDSVQLAVGQACLIYSQMRANVFRKHKPFVCVWQFTPATIATQNLLVLFLERMCVNVVEILKRTAGHWGFPHTSVLKKPQTP